MRLVYYANMILISYLILPSCCQLLYNIHKEGGLVVLEIILDRDSVCMGDDMDSHEKTIKITRPMKLSDFIDMVINLRYLPYIYGGKATWVMRYQNKPLAVIGIKNTSRI